MDLSKKIYVAGHRGLVGSAFCCKLESLGAKNLLKRTHAELDLCNQAAVNAFFAEERPEYVILAAAKVGGIVANEKYPAEFALQNMLIQSNVIDAAYRNNCIKFLFLGSSCIYPRLCPQPIKEEYLLTGLLEPTNEAFAVTKIAGIMLCKSYKKQYGFDIIAAMPGNLYGPRDSFHPENSHVLPAMIRRFHEAKRDNLKEVTIWGTGKALREFVHVDDIVDGALFLMHNYSGEQHVNIGSNEEMSMMELAERVAETVGFTGKILTDPSKPDGTPRKLMDSSFILNMGWKPSIDFTKGLNSTYLWYCDQQNQAQSNVSK